MLITCRECGRSYSDKTDACTECGCPTAYNLEYKEDQIVENREKRDSKVVFGDVQGSVSDGNQERFGHIDDGVNVLEDGILVVEPESNSRDTRVNNIDIESDYPRLKLRRNSGVVAIGGFLYVPIAGIWIGIVQIFIDLLSSIAGQYQLSNGALIAVVLVDIMWIGFLIFILYCVGRRKKYTRELFIVTYLLAITTSVISGEYILLVKALWILYFIRSKRVKLTFTE